MRHSREKKKRWKKSAQQCRNRQHLDRHSNMGIDIDRQRKEIIEKIIARQDEESRWAFDENVARKRPELRNYLPKYVSTVWTMLYLAELKIPPGDARVSGSLDLLLDECHNKRRGIFTIGRNHFPVPCLNGNMLYLNFYFKRPCTEKITNVIDFFDTHQRFDDGDFRAPTQYPYHRSCYGKHTCMWGIVKLAKGLSFMPVRERTGSATRLLNRCIDFILLHEVCFRSHDKERLIRSAMGSITFPNVGYKSDFLEILWILAREKIKHPKTKRALDMLKSKMTGNGWWNLERPVPGLITSAGDKNRPNAFVTEMAREVLAFYE